MNKKKSPTLKLKIPRNQVGRSNSPHVSKLRVSSRPLRVAVSGLNATESPGPGVAVIRCLRQAFPEIKIVGLCYDAMEPGIYSPEWADSIFIMPYPSVGESAYLERLKAIHHRLPIDVLIPTLDLELPLLIGARKKLDKLGIKTFLPDNPTFNRRSKATLPELAAKGEFLVPRTLVINEPSQIPTIHSNWNYPLFIKGSYYDAYRVSTPAEAVAHFYKIQAKWGLPILLQEIVNGVEFNAMALGDGKGGHYGVLAMRKTYITDKGKAWAGVSINDADLLKFAEKVISATRWRGPLEVELLKGRDGKFYLIEINPRFPAWVYLCAGCGINMPAQLVDLALGKKIRKANSLKTGMQFIRCAVDILCDMEPFEQLSINGEIIREEIP